MLKKKTFPKQPETRTCLCMCTECMFMLWEIVENCTTDVKEAKREAFPPCQPASSSRGSNKIRAIYDFCRKLATSRPVGSAVWRKFVCFEGDGKATTQSESSLSPTLHPFFSHHIEEDDTHQFGRERERERINC